MSRARSVRRWMVRRSQSRLRGRTLRWWTRVMLPVTYFRRGDMQKMMMPAESSVFRRQYHGTFVAFSVGRGRNWLFEHFARTPEGRAALAPLVERVAFDTITIDEAT